MDSEGGVTRFVWGLRAAHYNVSILKQSSRAWT